MRIQKGGIEKRWSDALSWLSQIPQVAMGIEQPFYTPNSVAENSETRIKISTFAQSA